MSVDATAASLSAGSGGRLLCTGRTSNKYANVVRPSLFHAFHSREKASLLYVVLQAMLMQAGYSFHCVPLANMH